MTDMKPQLKVGFPRGIDHATIRRETAGKILAALMSEGLEDDFITWGAESLDLLLEEDERSLGQVFADLWRLERKHSDLPLTLRQLWPLANVVEIPCST